MHHGHRPGEHTAGKLTSAELTKVLLRTHDGSSALCLHSGQLDTERAVTTLPHLGSATARVTSEDRIFFSSISIILLDPLINTFTHICRLLLSAQAFYNVGSVTEAIGVSEDIQT